MSIWDAMKLSDIEQSFPKALPYDIKLELRQQGVLPPRSTTHLHKEPCPIEIASMRPGTPTDRLNRLTLSSWSDPVQLHTAIQTDISELGELVLAYAENNRLYRVGMAKHFSSYGGIIMMSLKVVQDLRNDLMRTEDRMRAELEAKSGDDHITLRSYYLVKLNEAKVQAETEIRAAAERNRIAVDHVRRECDQRVALLENILKTRICQEQGLNPGLANEQTISKELLAVCVQQEIALAMHNQRSEQRQGSVQQKDREGSSSTKQLELDLGNMKRTNSSLMEEIQALQALIEVHERREKVTIQSKNDEIESLRGRIGELECQLQVVNNDLALSRKTLSDAQVAFKVEAEQKQAEIGLLDGVIKFKEAEIGRLKADKTVAALSDTNRKRRKSGSRHRRQSSAQVDIEAALQMRSHSPRLSKAVIDPLKQNTPNNPMRQKGRSNTVMIPDNIAEALGKMNSWHVEKRTTG